MLKRTLIIFGTIYAIVLLVIFVLVFALVSAREGQERRLQEKARLTEWRQLETEVKAKKQAIREEMARIEESDQRKVDAEALAEARAALEDLVGRMRAKFDSWYERTDALAENVSHMKSVDEVRAYFESVLDGSEDIERLMLYQFGTGEQSPVMRIVLDVARPPSTSLEGEGVYLSNDRYRAPGFKRMNQDVMPEDNQAGVDERVNLPFFESWKTKYGLIEVRFQRNEFLRTLVKTDPPFGYGFGVWGSGLSDQGITSFPDMAYEIHREWDKREATVDIWSGKTGDMDSQVIAGRIPGWDEEVSQLFVLVNWKESYGFDGVLSLLMPAEVIYNTDWKKKELARLEQQLNEETDRVVSLQGQSGAAAGQVTVHAAVRAKLLILLISLGAAAVFLLFWLIIPAFVYADASKLGLPAGLWTFLVFVSSVIGLVVYLLVRPRNRVVCHACGGAIEESFVVCPSCGAELKATCPSCGKTVAPEWKLCPYCRAELAGETPSPSGRGLG